MSLKTILTLTEKKFSLGFIAALLTAIIFLSGYVKIKDIEVTKWIEKAIDCEEDKIKRLDQSLYETKELLNRSQELLNKKSTPKR